VNCQEDECGTLDREKEVTPKELAEHEGKPIALAWIERSLVVLREYERWLAGGAAPDTFDLVRAALEINFSLPATLGRKQGALVGLILETFARSRAVLVRSDRYFVGVTERAAKELFPPEHHADIPPAYAIFEEAIYFTPRFEPFDPSTGRGFGPMCRAAMVLHESVHVVDVESGEPQIHISEWDEPGFSAQTAEDSVHNPSAYASFAAQVHAGAREWPRAARYGAGRRAD
jgi:hypothetical protein